MEKKYHLKNILLGICVLFVVACSKPDDRQVLRLNLKQKLDSLITNIGVPGGNMSVILPNGDSITFSSGYADCEKKQPMAFSNKILSGSIGKTYVAAIAFQLIQDKKLNMSDKVVDLLKDEKWISKIANINELTVEMLLTHTSGLPRYEYYDSVWIDIKANPDMVWSPYDRMRYIFNEKPLHEAGKAWAYSDSNYILLGAIIEKITGKDYYDSFRSLIASQGLNNTIPANNRSIKGLASGYSGFLTKYGYNEKVAENETICFNPQMEWCGGGVASTATDLARWAKLLYEGKVISPESVSTMVKPAGFETDLPDGARYGCGAIVWQSDSSTYYGHTGFFPGYRSIVQYSPAYHYAIALQVNRDNPSTTLSLNMLIKPFNELLVEYIKRVNNGKTNNSK